MSAAAIAVPAQTGEEPSSPRRRGDGSRTPRRKRRADALRRVYDSGAYNPEDLIRPQLPRASVLHRLRRTEFSANRIADIITVLRAGWTRAEPTWPADVKLLSAATPMQLSRFRSLLLLPRRWESRQLPAQRFALGVQAPEPKEAVLFALVPERTAGMASPSHTAGGRWLEVVPPEKLQAVLTNTWVDVGKTAFRGMRTLYAYLQERYLGVPFSAVEEFVRRQELHQMAEPPLVDTTAPLEPRELGWLQADIMYATWDETDARCNVATGARRLAGTADDDDAASCDASAVASGAGAGAGVGAGTRTGTGAGAGKAVGIEASLRISAIQRERAELKNRLAASQARRAPLAAALEAADRTRRAAVTVARQARRRAETRDWRVSRVRKLRYNTQIGAGNAGLEALADWTEEVPPGQARPPIIANNVWGSIAQFLDPRIDVYGQLRGIVNTIKASTQLPTVNEPITVNDEDARAIEAADAAVDAATARFDAANDAASMQVEAERTIRQSLAVLRAEQVRLERGIPSASSAASAGGAAASAASSAAAESAEEAASLGAAAASLAASRVGAAASSSAASSSAAASSAASSSAAASSAAASSAAASSSAAAGGEEEELAGNWNNVPAATVADAAAERAAAAAIPRPGKFPYLLNVMDIFSKYAWSFPIKDMTAASVAECLELLWLQEGAPTILQTDGGSHFVNGVIDALAERYNVQHRLCAPYHSQCSGAIERFNRTLRTSMRQTRIALSLRASEWVTYLPYVVASYNAVHHSTTSLSPYFVQRGRHPRMLSTTLRPSDIPHNAATARPASAESAGAAAATSAATSVAAAADGADADGAAAVAAAAAAAADDADDADEAAASPARIAAAGAAGEEGIALAGGQSHRHGSTATIQSIVRDAFAAALGAVPMTPEEDNAAAALAYTAAAAVAKETRDTFVRAGIRHAALGMRADALHRAGKALDPLPVGSIVRVSAQHIDKVLRRAMHSGLKRGKDLLTWSEDLYYVVDAPPTGPAAEADAAASVSARPHYLVLPVGQRANDEQMLHVRRQDLLAVSSTPVNAAQLALLRNGRHDFLRDIVQRKPGPDGRPRTFL